MSVRYFFLKLAHSASRVGKFPKTSDFKEVKIILEDGDIIYLFSDGFSDQFGGERGNKLKKSKFKHLLLSAQGKSLNGQKYFLENALIEWKGKYDQVDDICVMGVKFVSN